METKIQEHMPIIASCGKTVGKVDRVEGLSIKLAKDAPAARGEHRFIPLNWVESVDTVVHLRKNSSDVEQEWQAHPVQEGEYPEDIKK